MGGLLLSFGTFWPRVALIGAALTVLFVWRQNDKTQQREIGARQIISDINEANANATKLGKSSASKSGNPISGNRKSRLFQSKITPSGERDPTTRD